MREKPTALQKTLPPLKLADDKGFLQKRRAPSRLTTMLDLQSEQKSEFSSTNSSFMPAPNSPSHSMCSDNSQSSFSDASQSFFADTHYRYCSSYLQLPKGCWLPYENKTSELQLPKTIKIFHGVLTHYLTTLKKEASIEEELILTSNLLFAGDCIHPNCINFPTNFDIYLEYDTNPKKRLMLTHILRQRLKLEKASAGPQFSIYQCHIKNFNVKIHIHDPGTLQSPYFRINSLRASYDEKHDKLHMLFHTAFFPDAAAVKQHIKARALQIPRPLKLLYCANPLDNALRILHSIRFCLNGWHLNKKTSNIIYRSRYLLKKPFVHESVIQELGNLNLPQQINALKHYNKRNLLAQLFVAKPKTFLINKGNVQQKLILGINLHHLYELYHSGCWLKRQLKPHKINIILHHQATLVAKPQHLLCAFRIAQHYQLNFFNQHTVWKYYVNAVGSDQLHNNFPALHKEFCYLFLQGHALQNFQSMYQLGIFALLFAGAYRQLYHKEHLQPMLIIPLDNLDRAAPAARSLKLFYNNILTLELLDLLITFQLVDTFKNPKGLNKLLKNMTAYDDRKPKSTPWTYKPLWDKLNTEEQHKLCGVVSSLFKQTHRPITAGDFTHQPRSAKVEKSSPQFQHSQLR